MRFRDPFSKNNVIKVVFGTSYGYLRNDRMEHIKVRIKRITNFGLRRLFSFSDHHHQGPPLIQSSLSSLFHLPDLNVLTYDERQANTSRKDVTTHLITRSRSVTAKSQAEHVLITPWKLIYSFDFTAADFPLTFKLKIFLNGRKTSDGFHP